MMINWKKVEPGDRTGLMAAAAIVGLSTEVDDVVPSGTKAALNTLEQALVDDATVEIGDHKGDPVAVVIHDGGSFNSFTRPDVRHLGIEYASWYHAFSEARDRAVDGLSYFADNERQYQWAIQEGFEADDEDHYQDQHLWRPSGKEVQPCTCNHGN